MGETKRAPMRRGPLGKETGSNAAGAFLITAALFGDVRAGRAAARSDVNDSSVVNASVGNPAGPDTAGATRENETGSNAAEPLALLRLSSETSGRVGGGPLRRSRIQVG